MRVLFLTPSFPWPLDEGVRIHVYHLLKERSAEHEVHLLSLIESNLERASERRVTPSYRTIRLAYHRVPKQPSKRLARHNIPLGAVACGNPAAFDGEVRDSRVLPRLLRLSHG